MRTHCCRDSVGQPYTCGANVQYAPNGTASRLELIMRRGTATTLPPAGYVLHAAAPTGTGWVTSGVAAFGSD